jgi:surfactin synthase thioesterase subunit
MDKLKASPDGISRVESDGFEWRMTLEDFENRANRPMELYAKTIKDKGDVNMLCLHGRQDKTIPWEESQLCAELAGAELAIIDGDHNFRGREASEQMIARVVEFCSSCL